MILRKIQVPGIRNERSTKQGVGSRAKDARLWGHLVVPNHWAHCPPHPHLRHIGPYLETDFLLTSTRAKETGTYFELN